MSPKIHSPGQTQDVQMPDAQDLQSIHFQRKYVPNIAWDTLILLSKKSILCLSEIQT
jgi:hypothetical protein